LHAKSHHHEGAWPGGFPCASLEVGGAHTQHWGASEGGLHIWVGTSANLTTQNWKNLQHYCR